MTEEILKETPPPVDEEPPAWYPPAGFPELPASSWAAHVRVPRIQLFPAPGMRVLIDPMSYLQSHSRDGRPFYWCELVLEFQLRNGEPFHSQAFVDGRDPDGTEKVVAGVAKLFESAKRFADDLLSRRSRAEAAKPSTPPAPRTQTMPHEPTDPIRPTLSEAQQWQREWSIRMGWSDPDNPRPVGELSGLLTTEHGELFETYRTDPKAPCDKGENCPLTCEEEEMADVLVRLFDWANERGIDLARAFVLKMRYNETRERRHGGKKM